MFLVNGRLPYLSIVHSPNPFEENAAHLEDPTHTDAWIVRDLLRKVMGFRDHQCLVSYPDDVLYVRYIFLSDKIHSLCLLLGLDISNATQQSNAFTVSQTVCLGLQYFASGHFLYCVSDAEHLGMNAMCCTVRKMVFVLLNCWMYLLYFQAI